MTNYKEILRLKSLGMTHTDIAASCGCGRNTVTRVLNRARELNIPALGNRDSGRMETAVPVKWKPVISAPIM